MIGVIGISHKTAIVGIRERFALNETDIVNFIGSLKVYKSSGKLVILSTCNRMEVYFYVDKNPRKSNYNAILKQFIKFWNVSEDMKQYFYAYYNKDAVRHLFKVACGLDAMILGEDQILGQVKEAYKMSAERDFTGPVLNRLFHKSFEVGKKVRTETAINEGASSISAAAVELASKHFTEFDRHPVLLIGAGETGELVLKSLQKKGSQTLTITNRTFEKAQRIAGLYEGKAVPMEGLEGALIESDLVVVSTGSREALVTKKIVEKVMPLRMNRPIMIVDISVPRNVEPKVDKVAGVTLYDIDKLQDVIQHNISKRASAVSAAHTIIDAYTDEFFSWMDTLNVTPTVKSIKEKFETLNSQELEKYKHKYSEKEFQVISHYGSFITDKFSNMIVRNFMSISDKGNRLEVIDFVNELFELKKLNQ